MSDDGWVYWTMRPPHGTGLRDGVLVAVPDYEVIEWRRVHDPKDAEPNVARVADLIAPQNQAWNVHDLLWRPVM